MHLDLKSPNVVLDSTLAPKLCDFGISALSSDTKIISMGSPMYMAPQVARRQIVSDRACCALCVSTDDHTASSLGLAVDSYGLGCVLHDLAHCNTALNGAGDAGVADFSTGVVVRLQSADQGRAQIIKRARACRVHLTESAFPHSFGPFPSPYSALLQALHRGRSAAPAGVAAARPAVGGAAGAANRGGGAHRACEPLLRGSRVAHRRRASAAACRRQPHARRLQRGGCGPGVRETIRLGLTRCMVS